MYIFRFRICFAAFGNLCVRAEERFSRLSRSNENTRAFIDSALRLWISVLLWWSVSKQATLSRDFSLTWLFVKELTRESPFFFFFIGRNSLSILCPSLTPSCPTPAVIEVPCMRKTEQQPSAWTIFAQLDFFLPFCNDSHPLLTGRARGESNLWRHIQTHLLSGHKQAYLGCFPSLTIRLLLVT